MKWMQNSVEQYKSSSLHHFWMITDIQHTVYDLTKTLVWSLKFIFFAAGGDVGPFVGHLPTHGIILMSWHDIDFDLLVVSNPDVWNEKPCSLANREVVGMRYCRCLFESPASLAKPWLWEWVGSSPFSARTIVNRQWLTGWIMWCPIPFFSSSLH